MVETVVKPVILKHQVFRVMGKVILYSNEKLFLSSCFQCETGPFHTTFWCFGENNTN